jgi:TonB family protein
MAAERSLSVTGDCLARSAIVLPNEDGQRHAENNATAQRHAQNGTSHPSARGRAGKSSALATASSQHFASGTPSPQATHGHRHDTGTGSLQRRFYRANTGCCPTPATPTAPVVINPAPATFSPPRFEAAYLHNPRPNYPAVSRRLGEEGKVLLRVLVSPDGRAAAVNLEKSSNFERLDEAARQAVAQWRFVPAKRGDEAVEATIIIPLLFRLED